MCVFAFFRFVYVFGGVCRCVFDVRCVVGFALVFLMVVDVLVLGWFGCFFVLLLVCVRVAAF